MPHREPGLPPFGEHRAVGRRRADERARLFWAVFDGALDAMVVVDDSRACRAANRSAAELLGVEREQLIGRSLQDYTRGEAATEDAWARFVADGSAAGEWTIVRADGVEREVEFTAKANVVPGLHLAVLRDVSERKAEAEALRASERRLRAIAESLEEGLVLLSFDGTLDWASGPFFELCGYEPGELLGRDAVSLLGAPDEQATTRERLAQRRSGVTERYEATLVRKNGELVPIRVTATPLLDDGGRPIASVGAIVDLSDERRRDVERRALEHELEQAQRMASLGRLAGGLAHDVNNILTVVIGNAELLRSGGSDAQDSIDEILTAGEHARGLTQRLLAFAGKRQLNPEPLDLNVVVLELEPMLDALGGAGIELELELGPEVDLVLAERTQVEQILLNLTVNARDAMPEGGTLLIETRPSRDPARPGVCLEVSDTGVGMSDEVLRYAFEPFFTTKPAGEGSGLGLSVVYGAVEQLGGQLAVRSEVGRGTTFTVTFPPLDAPSPQPVESRLAEGDPGTASETILVVDDNESVRTVIRRILVAAGYRVIDASSASHAEQTARAAGADVGLLLTDIVLPDADGFELAERIRRTNPDLPVVHMSGYVPRALPDEPVLRGSLLEKPFTPQALLDRVREALSGASDDRWAPQGRLTT